MNVVTLAGRLAKDPDVRNTNSGKTVAQGLALRMVIQALTKGDKNNEKPA